VAFLGDLPVIGDLFRNKKKVKNRINLIIIITPYIIPTSKDLSFVKRQLEQLKALEDKYTQNLKVRLEERRLDMLNNKLEMKKDLKEISDEIKKSNEEFKDY